MQKFKLNDGFVQRPPTPSASGKTPAAAPPAAATPDMRASILGAGVAIFFVGLLFLAFFAPGLHLSWPGIANGRVVLNPTSPATTNIALSPTATSTSIATLPPVATVVPTDIPVPAIGAPLPTATTAPLPHVVVTIACTWATCVIPAATALSDCSGIPCGRPLCQTDNQLSVAVNTSGTVGCSFFRYGPTTSTTFINDCVLMGTDPATRQPKCIASVTAESA